MEPVVIPCDWACRHCGYNLRTLSTAGRCPECGRAVAESLRHDPLPPIDARGRWLYLSAVIALLLGSLVIAWGVRISMTPWPETALLAIGVSGPRIWLPAANRQLAGFNDPKDYLATTLTFGGMALHLLGAALLTLPDADARATRYLRWGVRATIFAAIVFCIVVVSDGRLKYWGRGAGLVYLALLDLTHACFLYLLLVRLAQRMEAPVFAWWILGTWIALVLTYPTGMIIFLVALVGFVSMGIVGAVGMMLIMSARRP
jgi:hypothetical protein